nr:microtubule-associated protein futsch-like isoform X3 [Ipomoea batatas]
MFNVLIDCPRETPSSDLAKVSGQDASCNTQLCSDQVNQNDIDVRNNPSHENRTSAFAAQNQTSPPTTRRGHKPNSLMKPEEGYDHTWISVEGKSDKTPCQGKESKKRTIRPRKHLVSKGSHFTSGMSEADILKPTASQSLNTIEDFQTRERRAEEEIKPSDGEQLMPVLDSLKRAEEENKPSDGGFRSASTKKRSNSGETSKKRKRKCSPSEKAARKQAEKLVGSRIKVWWPIDQTFYEGGIASFDYFEKKHKVNYDDGDVEDLDLSIERWELIRDVKSAVDEQETVAGVVDLSEIKLGHVTNSDRSARSTCKARDGAELPVLKQEVEQRKVSRSNSAPSTSERAQDASVELPVVKQEVEKRKFIRIKPANTSKGEEGEKPKNKRRRTKKATPRFPVLDSEKVNVNGYQVKASAAPILEEIFEKHGDIAAKYPYPSRGFRASVFEVICDVIRQLRTNDWGIIVSMVGQMRTEVSDTAAAAHLEVSWLKQILDDILTEGDGQLASVIRNTSLVSKAARKDLTQRKAELVIVERSYEEAKRQPERAEQSKRTAERAVEVLESVKKKAQNDMELNFNKRNDLQNSLQTFEGFRVRENNGIVRVHCEDSGKELFAEKSQRCCSEPSH